MSEDKVSQAARQAYADAQKESDEAREREEEATKSKKNQNDKDKPAETGAAEPQASVETKTGTGDSSETVDEPQPTSEGDGEGNLAEELAQTQEKRIAELKDELAKSKDELARARADLYNLQQEYNAYARRTKAEVPLQQEIGVANVVNAMMGVLDEIELARIHEDLKGSFAAVATKLEQALESKFKVKRFGTKGDAFDPNLHQAIQMLEGAEGDNQVIDQVAQPGYLLGERVLRPAMVVVGAAASSEAKEDTPREPPAADETATGDESHDQ